MNEKRQKVLLEKLIEQDDYITSEMLGNLLDVSSRTIRNNLKELAQELIDNGAKIISRPKYGIYLEIHNEEKFKLFYEKLQKESSVVIPTTSEERTQYLLEYLLARDSYVKLDYLCENLYISKTSLSQDLKVVRDLLKEYNLRLLQKPNYGIKVDGREFDLRLCIANSIIAKLNQNRFNNKNDKAYIKKIADILQKNFQGINYNITDISFRNLIVHIYIAIERIKEKCYVPLDKGRIENIYNDDVYDISKQIVFAIEKEFNISMPECEVGYIAIHLASKKIVNFNNDKDKNVVIDDRVNKIIIHMLEQVYDSYKIDFMDDLELRMALALHLIPFEVRVKYDMILKNPLIREIKTRFTLAYSIGVSACEVLKEQYNKEIQEDEIGYFALHFNLALERKKNIISKKNILIVCSTGRGTAQLLVYRFKEEFGKYLNDINTCDTLSIKKVDFSNIDYVITTVPIKEKIPVPILQIEYFLDDRDIKLIKKVLSDEKSQRIEKYFDRRLFLTDLDFKTKEEVLRYMTKKIKAVKKVPNNFYSYLIKREKLSTTEFGNLVAIPHPSKALSDDTFICIAILNKPILWDKKKVQLIYLLSIENSVNKNLQLIYQVSSKMLMNQDYVKKVIKQKDYDETIQLLSSIDNKMK